MARLVTLAKLRGLARLYADQRPGGNDAFVPDTDGGVSSVASVNDLINLAVAEFYDLLVAARGGGQDYVRSNFDINILAGTKTYNLPENFYEALSVVLEWGDTDIELVQPVDRIEGRPALNNLTAWCQGSPKGYRVLSTQIEFMPGPTAPVLCRMLYVPTTPVLVNDADTIDCINGWEKLPALRVAMELRTIEEMPYGDLERLFEREKERIMELASERQAGRPKQVQDVFPEGGASWPFARRRDP